MISGQHLCECDLGGREMKMEKKSTYGLRLDQLADLFAAGSEDPDPAAAQDGDTMLASLLREQLTCAGPKGSLLCDTLVMMMDRQGYDVGSLGDRSLGEVLLSPQSDIGLLRAVKDCCKTLSCSLDSKTETALARTLYFAALTGALVYHDAKITQLPYETLAESLALLIEKGWMAPDLVELFSRARRICEERSDKT